MNNLSELEVIAVNLPAIAEPNVLTLRNLLDQNPGKVLSKKARDAIQYINAQTDSRYDLLALTAKELMSLQKGMTEFLAGESANRADQLYDFIFRLPRVAWAQLSESEKNTIKYSRKRDWKSAPGEFKSMRSDREKKLVEIIMKSHQTMTDYNAQFTGEHYRDVIKNVESSAIFFTEKFLVQNVALAREPVYTKTALKNLLSFMKYNSEVTQALDKDDLDALDLDQQITLMARLVAYHREHNKLTVNQRKFAFDLMAQYSMKLQMAPDDIKEKVPSYNE